MRMRSVLTVVKGTISEGQEPHLPLPFALEAALGHDIEIRVSAKEPSDDVPVEILVRCKPQHLEDVPIGAGLAVVPVCPRAGTVARIAPAG